ncbi:MAG: FAD-dependent oxidoreductase [candidate division FCPU426 bacterium]
MSETTVILGAGLAGLSAAYHAKKLGKPHQLFEREAREGGLVRSERVNGFTFDYTGHLLHLSQARSRGLVLDELGLKNAFVTVERDAWVYLNKVFSRAPFQANLFGQPDSVIRECLEGILKAQGSPAPSGPENFESWNLRNFGEGIYRHFMEPYNSKLWGLHPSKMSTAFMGRFVPKPSLAQVFEGALSEKPKNIGYNANFLYPRRGGIEVLARGFASHSAAHLGHIAVQIDLKAKEVSFANGRRQRYGQLISSLPLPRLVALLKQKPAAIAQAASRLRATSVMNVNLGVSGRDICSKQWIYVPEKNLPFYRVGFYHNFSKELAPRGASSLYAEISHAPDKPLDKKKAVAQVRKGLIAMGILRPSDRIAAEFVTDIPSAYVVYDDHRAQSVGTIQAFLKKQGVQSIGRWGNWEYASMEDAIWQGAEAVGWKY